MVKLTSKKWFKIDTRCDEQGNVRVSGPIAYVPRGVDLSPFTFPDNIFD